MIRATSCPSFGKSSSRRPVGSSAEIEKRHHPRRRSVGSDVRLQPYQRRQPSVPLRLWVAKYHRRSARSQRICGSPEKTGGLAGSRNRGPESVATRRSEARENTANSLLTVWTYQRPPTAPVESGASMFGFAASAGRARSGSAVPSDADLVL